MPRPVRPKTDSPFPGWMPDGHLGYPDPLDPDVDLAAKVLEKHGKPNRAALNAQAKAEYDHAVTVRDRLVARSTAIRDIFERANRQTDKLLELGQRIDLLETQVDWLLDKVEALTGEESPS